jgi:tryptophanyl-tRNA synthetase
MERQKLEKLLNGKSIKYELVNLPIEVGNEPDLRVHAKFHKKDLKYMIATLVYKTENGFVAVQKRGDCKVKSSKIKKQLHIESLSMANPEELASLGFVAGHVPVLGLNLPVYIDEKVKELEILYTGVGTPEFCLKLSFTDLCAINNSILVDVCEVDTETNSERQRILSGITPSSSAGLHLGNYLGAIKQHVEFQENGECFYFVADLHALNTVFNPKDYAQNVLLTYMDYLALGIDIKKTHFYVESLIPEISQLQTILNNVVMVAQMKRMHAFKDKMGDANAEVENINMGLFNYPILMAADILIFEPDIIPVGADQAQHVEVCMDMAKSFNARYGKVLKVPKLYIKETAGKILGTDGERKMSKSLGNALTIFADEKVLEKQVMSIITDRNRIHPNDPGDPSKNVIFSYYKLLGCDKNKIDDFENRYRLGTIGDLEIKKDFYKFFLEYFAEFRIKRNELEKSKEDILELMKAQSSQVREIAKTNLEKVRRAIGGIV